MKHSSKFASYALALCFFISSLTQSLSKKEHLIQSLYDIGVFKFGNFTLKSGKTSPFYIDMRMIMCHPEVLEHVADCLGQMITGHEYDYVCGVPYSGLIIATALSLKTRLPMLLKRKEAKDYGTKKMVEGNFLTGDRCLVIEDVVTTGQSILETTTVLENEGLMIGQVIVLIDRQESGVANVARKGHTVRSVLTLKEIAHYLHAQKLISTQEFDHMTHAITSSCH